MKTLTRLFQLCMFAAMAAIVISPAPAQTTGSVSFNTNLVSVNGKWGTKHYVVAWVTKEDGTFIKTLWKQGKSSFTSSEWGTNCPSWNTARGGTNGSTAFDGYTSATAADYTSAANNPIDPVWNCQDASGAVVPDGNYKFWVQYGHSDAAGPVTTNGLLWTKRSTTFSNTYTNTSSFTSMSVIWTPTVPEIAIEQPAGTNLTDGTSTINCGSVGVGSSSGAFTFTVRNSGTGALTLTNPVAKDGANAADFTVSSIATSVAAGGSTTFTVTFNPSAVGARTAALHLTSNDANESPFDINLTGTGLAAAEIAVEQPAGTNLTDGAAVVNFGSINLGGSSAAFTFTVKNTGTAILSPLGITKDGTNAADFAVGTLATSVAAAGSTTFTVAFTPAAAGTRTAAIHITSNDANESPFDISLTGTGGTVPEIAVEQPAGSDLTDGGAAIAFGSANVGQPATVRTFTVRNPGSANLTGLGVAKDGPHAADFTVGALGATTLPPGGSTTFNVTFTPGASGSRTAALHISSNDADENPFDLDLTGIGENLVYTAGTASMNATLGSQGASEHWSVVWLTKDDGTFIKTLGIRGNFYAGDLAAFWDAHWNDHCPAWVAARGASQALDGFTGATAASYTPPHNPLQVTWNGRDANNNLMPDGTYKLWIQYSEDDESNPGPVTTSGLVWTKGATASTVNPPNQGTNFTAMSVVWTPTVVSAFDAWAVSAGLGAGANPAAAPKGDGVTNLQKFAFNMDGSKADLRRLAVGAGGIAGLPGTEVANGPVLRMEYIRRKASTNPGITYTAQFGSDLTGWTTVAGQATSIDETWERVVVTDPPPAGAPIRFGRVIVSQP